MNTHMIESTTRGFQFPGTFEVTAFGEASPELQGAVLVELAAAGVVPDPATLRTRDSRGGRFLAVTVSFCEGTPLPAASSTRTVTRIAAPGVV